MATVDDYAAIHRGFRELHDVNEAIAEAIFSAERAGLPVYLDFEQSSLRRIAQLLMTPEAEVADRIRRSVRGVTQAGGTLSFGRFDRARGLWSGGSKLDTPPFLAFLAVASMAAEKMVNDDAFSAAAYYPRLAAELGLEDRLDEVGPAYRAVCDRLWDGLVQWLNEWEGERGLPTVSATSKFPYVSKAISQALVREADRATFPRLFASSCMEPQQDLAVEDMVAFLDGWVPQHATLHLRRLWKKHDVRPAIAEAACAELRTWTGMASADDDNKFLTRLVGVVRKSFGRRLELNLEVLHPDSSRPRDLLVKLADGTSAPLAFVPTGGRSLRLADASLFGRGDLLGGRLHLNDEMQKLSSVRLPRTVVPLRLDEATRMYVECDRVVLGVPHLVLAQKQVGTKSQVHPIAEQVRRALSEAARSGWTEIDDIEGLPPGWVLFVDVELLGSPQGLGQSNFALRVLQPLSTSSITLSGGLQVPGAVRRWSSLRPPHVTVITEATDGQTLTVSTADGRELFKKHSNEQVQVVELEGVAAGDGEYVVHLRSAAAERTTTLRLVSSSNPSLRPLRSLAYRPAHQLGALSASETSRPGVAVAGTAVDRYTPIASPARSIPPADPWWLDLAARPPADASAATPLLKIPDADPDSCAATGAHIISNLPVWTGRITSKFMTGTCQTCGIVKQYPMRPRYIWNAPQSKKGRAAPPKQARRLDLTKVPPIPEGAADLWDPILDALSYMGSGSAAELERLAVQVEGSALATDRLARGLEALGHLDVELDPETLRPAAWSISPTTVAEISPTAATLTGHRSQAMIRRPLTQVAEDAGVWVEILENPQLCSSIRLTASTAVDWENFARRLEDASGRPVQFSAAAAMHLAGCLPPISALRTQLPERRLPPFRKAERWNPALAKWLPADDAGTPGGYRLTGFGIAYVIRSSGQVQAGTASICTVQLLKHLLALEEGEPLLAYRAAEGALIARLGADLPALYGRAATLCSGLAAIEDTRQRCLVYRDVSAEVAETLFGALTQ
jgi:hypothetical protein